MRCMLPPPWSNATCTSGDCGHAHCLDWLAALACRCWLSNFNFDTDEARLGMACKCTCKSANTRLPAAQHPSGKWETTCTYGQHVRRCHPASPVRLKPLVSCHHSQLGGLAPRRSRVHLVTCNCLDPLERCNRLFARLSCPDKCIGNSCNTRGPAVEKVAQPIVYKHPR